MPASSNGRVGARATRPARESFDDELENLALDARTKLGLSDRRGTRESTVESADDAAGIFDLYGTSRESWAPSHGGRGSSDSLPRGEQVLERNEGRGHELSLPDQNHLGKVEQGQAMEELAPPSPMSWAGPMEAISNGDKRYSAASNQSQNQGHGAGGRNTLTPDITVTPELDSSRRNRDLRFRDSTISDSTSTTTANTTPTRLSPSVSRLSPAARHAPGVGVGGNAGAGTSQASFGSSQYPGEEADAFHVRSTYARLEAEGVHGDGWEAGVERTRGGPSSAGKRATVMEPSKGTNLGEDEREFLASLDRYGFVNEPLRNRSETRLALIPVAPLLKFPKLPSTSPLAGRAREEPSMGAGPGGDGPSPRIPDSPRLGEGRGRKKEEERVDKWMKMMSVKKRDQGGNIAQWGWKPEVQNKIVKRVYKGVPDRWRMAAWWTLAEDASQRNPSKGKGKRSAEDLARDYMGCIDQPSTFDVQIDLDVPRTISGHTLFVTRYGAGQRSLFHVLHCFSMLCETCGYVQGMGPIAATLLCYFDPERVYALLVRLHDDYGMHSILAPGFPGLLEAFYVQERLMEWLMPDVFQSFSRNMISSSAWGTKWYITLFVNTVPFSQQLRLWDAIWLDGRDVVIMTSVAILWAFKDLLAAPTATFESILSLLSSYFVAEDEDKLMRWIRRMLRSPGVREKMDGWREEWSGLVREGKTDGVLL